MKPTLHRAFTLLEIVVVMALLVIGAVIALPSFTGARHGTGLEQAARRISEQFALARQQAIASNQPVRLLLLPSSSNGAPGDQWQTLQLAKTTTVNPYASITSEAIQITPIGRIIRLPEGYQLNLENDLSTLITQQPPEHWTHAGTTWPEARFIEFRPDGSTSLPPTPAPTVRYWTLTVCTVREATSLTPTHAWTLVLEPRTGRLKLLTP